MLRRLFGSKSEDPAPPPQIGLPVQAAPEIDAPAIAVGDPLDLDDALDGLGGNQVRGTQLSLPYVGMLTP